MVYNISSFSYAGDSAFITDDCINCGKCRDKCEFNAIYELYERHWVDHTQCHLDRGCNFRCKDICAVNAICKRSEVVNGQCP